MSGWRCWDEVEGDWVRGEVRVGVGVVGAHEGAHHGKREEEGEEGGRARGGVLGVGVKRVVVGLGLGLGC